MTDTTLIPTLNDNSLDPMSAVYVLIIHFSIYTFLGFTCSFISEYSSRKRIKSTSVLPSYCSGWCENIGEWRAYYHSFALHVFDEGSTISSIISMYCICQQLYGNDISEWKLLTRQPKPSMILLLSFLIWSTYKLGSLIYVITIDIFSWFQVFAHLIDCNYLYEMFIAHSQSNKNPIIQWMHRQYVYFCSIPLWFMQFVFLLRWSHVFSSTNSALFICILLSILFGLLNIFYVILWCDLRSFSSECKRWYQRGFRLRFCYRGCQFISRMVWLSYFWIFLGSGPFFILALIIFLNHTYLYFKGYLTEIYYIITKFFIIPDISIGVGYRNTNNHKKVDWLTKIMYIITHCAGCIIGIWVIVEEDLLFIDILMWIHWFEDLLLWAIITGICHQQKSYIFDAQYSEWDKIWNYKTYTAFYSLGIITWFFSGAYFLVLRIEDFIEKTKQPLSISQGILGLAESGEWNSLDKFLPRMKKISINRKNLLDNNKTAIHYAIEQNEWSIVKKLIEYGANVNIMDRNHQSGVHLMCLNRSISDMDIFKLFLNAFDGDPLTKRDNSGKTILHLICQNGSDKLSLEERLKFFFESFYDDTSNSNNKIDVNIADNDGCTPLHYIVEESNDISAIEILITHGALIDIEDNKKRTPLIHAVCTNQNNPTAIRYLLSNGANINHQDDKGWTPLHFAANSNLTDNVFILLEYFPNITVRNNAGKNAYNLADSMGYTTIADTLKMNMPIEELIEMDPKDMSIQTQTHMGTETNVSENMAAEIMVVNVNDSVEVIKENIIVEVEEEQVQEEKELLLIKIDEEKDEKKDVSIEVMDVDVDDIEVDNENKDDIVKEVSGDKDDKSGENKSELKPLLSGIDDDGDEENDKKEVSDGDGNVDMDINDENDLNENDIDEVTVKRVSEHIELTDTLKQNNEYHD